VQRDDRAQASAGKHFIAFDMEKTLPLPKLAVADAFYLRQLWLYNVGVHAVYSNLDKSTLPHLVRR